MRAPCYEARIERTRKMTLRLARHQTAGQELHGADHAGCPNLERAPSDFTIRRAHW